MQCTLILIRYGELSLKSAYVRRSFESTLIQNIKRTIIEAQLQGTVTRDRGRIYLQTQDIQRCCLLLQRVFGIVSLSPAVETIAHPDDIATVALKLMQESLTKGERFAIRATRAGTHTFTSQDIAVRVGDEIVHTLHAPVDLTHPDVELFIEVRDKKAFLFTQKIKGVGGLPRGTQGKVLALIDTPASMLAAWFLMHRGCNVLFLTTSRFLENELMGFQKKWFVAPGSITVDPHASDFYTTLEHLATDYHCDALVTGHTLTDAKATIAQLSDWKQHSTIPLLTPLIAMGEQEIRARCREVGVPL